MSRQSSSSNRPRSPGARADAAGGYAERGLAGISLRWTLDRTRNAGLAIDDSAQMKR